jgi:hypothetical protein
VDISSNWTVTSAHVQWQERELAPLWLSLPVGSLLRKDAHRRLMRADALYSGDRRPQRHMSGVREQEILKHCKCVLSSKASTMAAQVCLRACTDCWQNSHATCARDRQVILSGSTGGKWAQLYGHEHAMSPYIKLSCHAPKIVALRPLTPSLKVQ